MKLSEEQMRDLTPSIKTRLATKLDREPILSEIAGTTFDDEGHQIHYCVVCGGERTVYLTEIADYSDKIWLVCKDCGQVLEYVA